MRYATSDAFAEQFDLDTVVIDDNEELTLVIADSFRRSGISVKVALSSAKALAMAETCYPRVALVDYSLPGGDGIALIRKLKPRWPHTEFIMLSGALGGLTEASAREVGIRTFVNKPVPISVLRRAVQGLIQSVSTPRSTGENSKNWLSLGLGSPRNDGESPVSGAPPGPRDVN